MPEGVSEVQKDQPEANNVKARWVIPQKLDNLTFVGKDVCAVAYDIYIIFLNFKSNTELVYVANCEGKGDGVDVIAGHRSHVFAFAEKSKNPRILIMNYPIFTILATLTDSEVNRYKGLCMMESDLIAGFSGFPNYCISVWSWRTHQRLICVPTDVIRRTQIYMSSRTHMMICQCWGEGLTVWEVSQCYKRCFIMKRTKEEAKDWEVSDPKLVATCWSNEGQLYAIDGNLTYIVYLESKKIIYRFQLLSDGIGMVTNLDWSENLKGTQTPHMCSFSNGLLIYGPDKCLRSLKKAEHKWLVAWKYTPEDVVDRLVSNPTSDAAVMWTSKGFVYKITGESEEKIEVKLFTFKQRNIKRIQLIAPDYEYIATMNNVGVLCIYEVMSAKLVLVKYVKGEDVSFEASPVDPLLVVFGEVGHNYGIALYLFSAETGLEKVDSMCLTHQLVSRVVFSPKGRELVAAAMSAGHIFILKLSTDYKLSLVRYTELGRGLADCFLMQVGDSVRVFSLVLFSDKYGIGERIICINAETGKDNKFAGKMAGPYARLLPLKTRGEALAVPHLTSQMHVLRLSGEKGVTVSVKMGPIIETGHHLKHFVAFINSGALLTFGADGTVVMREPSAPERYELQLIVTHRYESGVEQAVIDAENRYIVSLARNGTLAVHLLRRPAERRDLQHAPPPPALFEADLNGISIISHSDKNYLDLLEDKKVREEAMDYKRQREEVLKSFETIQSLVVGLLEENLAERPLHQLSLSEFNLHFEHKKERIKQAEKEREQIRLETEARIRAQDKVTAWIKLQCWDTMLAPRVKLYAIFSHYQVENYAVLPTQRENWPELQQIEALRGVEMENDSNVFQPWVEPLERTSGEEPPLPSVISSRLGQHSAISMREGRKSMESQMMVDLSPDESVAGEPYVLSGSNAHRYIDVPPFMIPQTMAFTFLQMNWLQHIVKLNVQNMRLWFNKQFTDLMTQKKREVNLVEDRNARLRFIIDELNKLSDLRGSFHHLIISIRNPDWRQEEQPQKLIKVEPEECSIEPYISPSQVIVPPPEPKPKDDFKERALMYMMDGVLEKLWHEEIKKPIPKPLCMLEKDPENFNEDDLRMVFDYEAKVAFRNEERDKYRKMLHAEYAKLSQILNEGIVKFNNKVKEMWLTKLKVDSVIGQENLNLMRLRRTNLDRVEMAEHIEMMRDDIKKYEDELEVLQKELNLIQEQSDECQATYDNLAAKDKYLDRTFKNHFADLSPIIVDQCYKFFKKRPKWYQRATMIPVVLYDLATAVLTGVRPVLLHVDCVEYFKGVEVLDQISNMPPVMDEGLWATTCKLRRVKIENEIRICFNYTRRAYSAIRVQYNNVYRTLMRLQRFCSASTMSTMSPAGIPEFFEMRALAQELSHVELAASAWRAAAAARRLRLAGTADALAQHRRDVELAARDDAVQLVLPAGQVEIVTTGHFEDYEDATLIPRGEIDKVNEVILKVGEWKLTMMKKQIEFRKGILSKEWEHAQMKMKLRHMEQELYSYQRLKIPKELQRYLKNKELGYTDEQDYVKMEKEMEASKTSVNKLLNEQIQKVEELEVKIIELEGRAQKLEKVIVTLNVKVSEKKLHEDPLEPIRIRRIFKKRMETMVQRSQLVRQVQDNHTRIVLLQTELELLRLKTYPTLASFRTFN